MKFDCKHCGFNIEKDDRYAGKDIFCPECNMEIKIPALTLGEPQEVTEKKSLNNNQPDTQNTSHSLSASMITLSIDFGSSRTKVAYFNQETDKSELIELGREVRNIIPSVFYLPEAGGDILVGDNAQDMVDTDPQGVVINLKTEIHKMGKKRCGPGRIKPERIELASELFKYIKHQCETEVFHNNEITSCILTVPVCFEDQKRKCIKKAAELAGFTEIKLIEEPVAAARYWLTAYKGNNIPDEIIICDVGGGTTDLAVLQYKNGKFISYPDILPAGLHAGGNDIDEAIWEQIMDEQYDEGIFKKATGFILKIRKIKESLKKYINNIVPLSLLSDQLGVSKKIIESTIDEFVNRLQDEVKSFITTCQQKTGDTNIPVLLVGGASRLNGLKEAVEEISNGDVYLWKDSDYATVLGAAWEKTANANNHDDISTANKAAYRMAVEMAWADKILEKSEIKLLNKQYIKLGLTEKEAEIIDIEVMGRTKVLDDAGVSDSDKGKLTIIKAKYGVDNSWDDVSDKLKEKIQDEAINLQINNDTMGNDPAVGLFKYLKVIYRTDGKQKEIEVGEGEFLSISLYEETVYFVNHFNDIVFVENNEGDLANMCMRKKDKHHVEDQANIRGYNCTKESMKYFLEGHHFFETVEGTTTNGEKGYAFRSKVNRKHLAPPHKDEWFRADSLEPYYFNMETSPDSITAYYFEKDGQKSYLNFVEHLTVKKLDRYEKVNCVNSQLSKLEDELVYFINNNDKLIIAKNDDRKELGTIDQNRAGILCNKDWIFLEEKASGVNSIMDPNF